jgi:alanyl-tRNA synthetase
MSTSCRGQALGHGLCRGRRGLRHLDREIGVPAERVIRIGDNKGARYASDNFWMMGDTGPCGPCTEIFYDHGEHIWGGPPGSPRKDGDRYIEIWNNVFMQFNRDEAGRHASAAQALGRHRHGPGAHLGGAAARACQLRNRPVPGADQGRRARDLGRRHGQPALRVLADHIRACSFLIADGVIPGNEGRGYVLRRIIRRAIRHGYKLGARALLPQAWCPTWWPRWALPIPNWPAAARVMDVLKQEEERFFATIEHGMAILEGELAAMERQGADRVQRRNRLQAARHLRLPARPHRRHLPRARGARRQRRLRRRHGAPEGAGARRRQVQDGGQPRIRRPGHHLPRLRGLEAKGNMLALYKDGAPVNELVEGEMGVVVLDDTPFYAESGGQVGDRGELRSVHGIFAVEDTQKIQASVFGHTAWCAPAA